MANDFKGVSKVNVTTAQTIYAAPNTKTSILLELDIANTTASAVTASAELLDNGNTTDAFIVKYKHEDTSYIDVTRSEKMANIFDMYYDRYGKDAVQKIDYGCGTIRPNLWGLKPPEKKKRRKV